ncbi:MAG: YgiT-type zinc finger protein [Chloroflexi bacterium]|nr:YgiT-type zinc finger protein [Chloroflexota bacterium]MBI5080695.1 YgiT-type zinc finger protein [Chloroflexota bacterium]MBI5714476.1 YgiT-type zinc finger protein [Chloroflexota bacterium]
MKCLHCQGELHRDKTAYTINRNGYHLIIDNVSAWVCSQCGEPLFDEKQVDAIQKIIRKMDADVPLVAQVAA